MTWLLALFLRIHAANCRRYQARQGVPPRRSGSVTTKGRK